MQRHNGVLHVLDLLRWRGVSYDLHNSEFRFWFLASKLAELVPLEPRPPFSLPGAGGGAGQGENWGGPWPSGDTTRSRKGTPLYPYPFVLLSVPTWQPPIATNRWLEEMIPAAKHGRSVQLELPGAPPRKEKGRKAKGKAKASSAGPSSSSAPPILSAPPWLDALPGDDMDESEQHVQGDMEVEPAPCLVSVHFQSDGLLLYLKEAAYQAGSSPLAAWVPVERVFASKAVEEMDTIEEDESAPATGQVTGGLELFEASVHFQFTSETLADILDFRLLRKRIENA